MTDKEMKDMDETNEIDKTAMDETDANEITEAVENGTDTDAAAAEDPATTGAEAVASDDTDATDDLLDVVEDDLQFDVDFDGFVELRGSGLDDRLHRLGNFVRLAFFDKLCRFGVSLSSFHGFDLLTPLR